MKFTKEIKEKIWKISSACILREKPEWYQMPVGDANSFRLDWFENKGFPIIKKQCVYNTKTKRRVWGRKPNSSKSIFFLLGQAFFPTDVQIRYWVEIPNEIAEKILILGYVPDLHCTN
jgi:hypothetical protein